MSPDPVVAEVHRIREEIAARFNDDTSAIFKYVQELDAASDRKTIRFPPRRPVVSIAKPQQPSTAPVAH